MLDIFVSYSRKNLDFVQHLSDDLAEQGKQIWFDKKKEPLQGIPAGSRWWDEIKHGIETADNFLMIISPESMMSPYCHAEVAHALKHNKRIVTLLYCGEQSQAEILETINSAIDSIEAELRLPKSVSADIDNVRSLARRNWLELSQIQFVSYVNVRDWEQWLVQVLDAVDLDIQWVRTWSQFRQAVQIWAENDYAEEYRWPEPRLKPIREMIEKREQSLNEDEEKFLLAEQERLLKELYELAPNPESESRRLYIGDRLAVLGDLREGTGLKQGIPDIVWLPVLQAGSLFVKLQQFSVQPFYISKYLVTYAQYHAFIEADDGFNNREWWKGFPKKHQPQDLKEQRTQSANNPRDSISWYQSNAFARWLDAKYREMGLFEAALTLNPDNWQIRLPTEWEWQWAAQNGVEERSYPWGEWQASFANISNSGLGRAVAVGMYPQGAAACGTLDMSGNLREWCLNDYDDLKTLDTHSTETKVLRGGSFSSALIHSSCSSRAYYAPRNNNINNGFRLVISSPIEGI